MNRTLTSLLAAAAVVGATGGTFAAVALTDGSDEGDPRPAGSSRTSATSAAPGTPSSSAPTPDAGATGPGKPGDVLWVSERKLVDGDTEVPIQLVDRPASVERAEGGWVVTTMDSPQEPSFSAYTVTPDGSVTPLADTFLNGDVSPDGTRYVAMKDDGSGYGVWDVATQEEIEVVKTGTSKDQYPSGGAQFVGDDAVASTWTEDDGPDQEPREVVVLARLASAPDDPDYDESTEKTVVADDVSGQWAISPDGRWFAGTSASERAEGVEVPTCVAVAEVLSPYDSPTTPTVDCAVRIEGVPSFKDDSSAVLAIPADTDGFGPGLLVPVPTSGTSTPAEIDLPDASLDAVYLRDDLVLVRGARNFDGDGTVISACDSTGCEQVSSAGDAAETAVLGTQDWGLGRG